MTDPRSEVLHVDRVFVDSSFLESLTKNRVVKGLPAKTELRVALTVRRELDEALMRALVSEESTSTDHSHG